MKKTKYSNIREPWGLAKGDWCGNERGMQALVQRVIWEVLEGLMWGKPILLTKDEASVLYSNQTPISHYKVVGVQWQWEQNQATYRADITSISSLIKCFMVAHSHTKCIFTLTHFNHFWKSHNCFGDLSFKLMKIWGKREGHPGQRGDWLSKGNAEALCWLLWKFISIPLHFFTKRFKAVFPWGGSCRTQSLEAAV